MSMWGEVIETLRTMNVWQLLFAFVACTAYALAQGRLLDGRGKGVSLVVALLGAAAFVVEAERWVDGVMLVAVAIAAMGLFAAFVWLTSRLLGMTAVSPPRATDSSLTLPPVDPDGAAAAARPRATPTQPAPSH